MVSPFVLVIFGATGDLTYSKLIPAIFAMYKSKQLPEDFFIYGFARRDFTSENFAQLFDQFRDIKEWNSFSKHLFYQQGLFDEKTGYEELVKKLEDTDKKMGACITRIFYLATPPQNYDTILDKVVETKLNCCGSASAKASAGLARIAIEKPFGKDLKTAKELDAKLAKIFEERQIFRVDHYLGKEAVQNMLVFRFANGIFDPIWNKEYIDNVQITFSENNGIRNRGNFFDGAGELLDIGQNHLMQLIAAVAMEMPKSFSKEGVRDVRAKALESLKCIEPSQVVTHVVRGQYDGYVSEKNVNPRSTTETFVAMKFFIDTPRFENVPFYVRAGKAMKENIIEISLVFKQTCHILFKEIGCPEEGNVLKIRIQPNEGISIQIIAKIPGPKLQLGIANMHFTYTEEYGEKRIDAYEKVLVDILTGEQMLFNRSDELQSSWEFIEKIVNGWANKKDEFYIYKQGSWGPKEALKLIEKDGRKWV